MEVNLSGQIGESENQSRLLLLPWEGLCLAVVLVEKVEVYFGLMNRSNPAWVKVAQIETCPAISQVGEGSSAARAVCFSNRMRGGGGGGSCLVERRGNGHTREPPTKHCQRHNKPKVLILKLEFSFLKL